MVAPHNQKKIDIVIDLRESGMSYAEIGRVLGVSRQAIRQMFLRAMARKEAGADV
jgi:DNA invertase Pin-like site-specific DNA recombinase